MGALSKPVKFTRLDVISICVRYFARTHPHRTLYITLIILLTLTSCALGALEKSFQANAPDDYEILYHYLSVTLMFQLGYHGVHFVRYYLFETYLSKYGAMVASHAMRRILYSEDSSIFDIPGGQIEYYATEGSKEMAKISRQFIFDLLPKSIDLFTDFTLLFRKDKTSGKYIFIVSLLVLSVLTIIKFYYVMFTSRRMKQAADLSYEREKVYTELFDNLSLLKAYNTEQWAIAKFQKKILNWKRAFIDFRFVRYCGKMIYDYSSFSFRIFIAIYYIKTHQDINVHEIQNVLLIADRLIRTSVSFVDVHQLFEESYILTGTILNYLSLANESATKKLRVDMFHDKIEARGLTYASRGRVIFSDVNFTLKKGDKAALYGRNGIGKSSIFKVLMNYDGYTGSVLFDGTDSRHFLMTDYRSLITYVPQDTKLFDDTIYGNLAFGNGRTYEEIVRESKRMKVHEKIMLLPNGYNTVVGEGGKNLNGGLRQKIFYTRAFLRDTPIYLFDEPTNNLDPVNSEFLLEYIGSAEYAEKTFLVICHDMQIVEQFPKIYKFSDENIILKKGN